MSEIKMDVAKLQEIADYYEFPLAVFFMKTGELKRTMRENMRKNLLDAKNRIKEVIDDLVEAVDNL